MRSGPGEQPTTAESNGSRPAAFSSSNGCDHCGRPWTYMGCPDEELQMFVQTSVGSRLPAAGSGNTKRKSTWMSPDHRSATQVRQSARGEDITGSSPVVGAARFMAVMYRVRRLFLTCILFLLESRCPSVRGCPRCGLFVNHKDGCKQTTQSRNVTTRHQAITAMQEK